jgi:hypothetical protein
LNTAEISDNTSKKLLIATKGPSWWWSYEVGYITTYAISAFHQ